MGQLLTRVKVEDFDRFWATFSSRGAEQRRKYDSRGSQVFRSEEDPNEVWVLFDWEPERFQAFLEDPDSKEIMQEAGLQGPPEARPVQDVGSLDS